MTARLPRLPEPDRAERRRQAITWLRSFHRLTGHSRADMAIAAALVVTVRFRKSLSVTERAWLEAKAHSGNPEARRCASILLELSP